MDKFETLTKYKQLLDQGIITQEEYDREKEKLLNQNVIREHLDKGARVAVDSLQDVQKRIGGASSKIKEKGRKWIEDELEKERIAETEKQLERKQKQRVKQNSQVQIGQNKKELSHKVKHFITQVLIAVVSFVVIIIALATVLFFIREKAPFSVKSAGVIHDLEYSIPNNFSEEKEPAKTKNEISSEAVTYSYYGKSNKSIAEFSIEYIGEDIDTKIVKEKICRSLTRESVDKDSGEVIEIDGWYKQNKLSPKSILSNGILKVRCAIYTIDHSSFLITYKCNLINYDSKACNQLFDSVKYKEYTNKNIAKSLDVSYKGSTNKGYEPRKEDFNVIVYYKNGKKSKPEIFNINGPKLLGEKDNYYIVECHGMKTKYKINVNENEDEENDDQTDSSLGKEEIVFGEDGLPT